MTRWDSAVDVVIVGSGGGGMVGALAATAHGASALVLEKQGLIGGSTAMSGGIVWVPNNPVMQSIGVPDSYEDAMLHFETVVGDVGPASSFERRHAFLTAGPEMVSFLQGCGVRFVYCRGYSDYYSTAKGGHDLGRGIEPIPFDGHALGAWLEKLQPGLAQSLGLAVMTNEARALSNYNRSVGAFTVSARVVARTSLARLRRQALLTNGASLIGQMLQVALTRRDRGQDRFPGGGADRRGGSRRGCPHREGRVARADPGSPGRAAGLRRLRPQRRDAPGVRRGPTQRRQVVDRQSGRYGRSTHGRHADRRQDRPDGRGLVAALTTHRPLRPVHPRPGPSASADDLRRYGRKALCQRVELVYGSGQRNVRPKQDEPSGAVLADFRRPLPEALRPPKVEPGSVPEEALRKREAQAGLDTGRPRETLQHRPQRTGRDRRAVQRERRSRHRSRLRAGRVGLQPSPGRPKSKGAPLPRPH